MSGEFAPSRVMPLVKAMGAPDAGNPHVRCDEGGGGAFTPPPYSTVLLSLPATAAAEWFDDYERGVEALRRGRPGQAIQFLEKAIRKRPEPGSNLITYGTNRLEEYFPYLKLSLPPAKPGAYLL